MQLRFQLTARPARLALLAGALAGPAVAADAHTAVRVGVSPACTFTQAPIGLSFPEIDPSGTATYVATRTLGMRCTNGTLLRFSVDGVSQSPVMRQLSIGATPYRMPYQLSWVVSSSTGSGFSASAQELTFTLTATLPPASYQDSTGGHYTDVLTLQITP